MADRTITCAAHQACQKQDWRRHKVGCKKARELQKKRKGKSSKKQKKANKGMPNLKGA